MEKWWFVWPVLGSTGEETSLRPRGFWSFLEKGHLIQVLKHEELDFSRPRKEGWCSRWRK